MFRLEISHCDKNSLKFTVQDVWCKRNKPKCFVLIIIYIYTVNFIIYLYIRNQLYIPPIPGFKKNLIQVDGRKIFFSCKNPVFISWNKLKFSPCKNSVLDPWSNCRHSPRQHVNYHEIFCRIPFVWFVKFCWTNWRSNTCKIQTCMGKV